VFESRSVPAEPELRGRYPGKPIHAKGSCARKTAPKEVVPASDSPAKKAPCQKHCLRGNRADERRRVRAGIGMTRPMNGHRSHRFGRVSSSVLGEAKFHVYDGHHLHCSNKEHIEPKWSLSPHQAPGEESDILPCGERHTRGKSQIVTCRRFLLCCVQPCCGSEQPSRYRHSRENKHRDRLERHVR